MYYIKYDSLTFAFLRFLHLKLNEPYYICAEELDKLLASILILL